MTSRRRRPRWPSGVADPSVGSNAHIGIGIGYNLLRLYELAEPHYTAAYELSCQDGDPDSAVPAICQTNLAEMHLEWALELYRVGEVAEAREAQPDRRVARVAGRPRRRRRRTPTGVTSPALLAGCARADGDDPAGAAAQIRTYAERIRASQRMDVWLFCMPFLAVALARSGRRDEALAVVEQALASFRRTAEWLIAAALTHTHAVLLAQTGAPRAAGGAALR